MLIGAPHLDWTASALLPLGLVAWALLLLTLPRDRAGLSVTALSVFTHVLFYAPRIHMHDTRAYWEILQVNGLLDPDRQYGEGRAALLAWPLWAMGFPIDGTHQVGAALATLAVPHLYEVVRRLFDTRTAVVAAVFLALAPLPLALAPTETAYVPLATMQILAVHGLLRAGLLGDAMLVVGAGLVTHLRPLEGLLGVAFVLVAWALGRRRAAVGVAALVVWRLWIFQTASWSGSAQPLASFVPSLDYDLVGVNGRVLFFDPWRTPAALTALAVLGAAVGARRAPRSTAGLVALGAFSTVAYLNMGFLADRMRYELPSQTWLCALAAVGLIFVAERRVLAVAAGGALIVSWWAARAPYPPMPWQTEYTTLRRALDSVPPGARVAYDDAGDNQGLVRAWAQLYAGVELVPLVSATPDVGWRWVGLGDHLHGVKPPLPSPALEVTIPPLTWPIDPVNNHLWHCDPCEDKPLVIGLYRVTPP